MKNIISITTSNKPRKKVIQQQRRRGTKKSSVIIVDTTNREVRNLLLKVKKLFPGLTIQQKAYKARICDALIVGSKENRADISLSEYDGRDMSTNYEVLRLSSQKGAIIDKIEKYYESSYNLACEDCIYYTDSCPSFPKKKKLGNLKIKDVIFDGQFIDDARKVSIYKNYVKIGFDVFEIYKIRNKKVIEVGNTIYRISSDDNNNKFLRRF